MLLTQCHNWVYISALSFRWELKPFTNIVTIPTRMRTKMMLQINEHTGCNTIHAQIAHPTRIIYTSQQTQNTRNTNIFHCLPIHTPRPPPVRSIIDSVACPGYECVCNDLKQRQAPVVRPPATSIPNIWYIISTQPPCHAPPRSPGTRNNAPYIFLAPLFRCPPIWPQAKYVCRRRFPWSPFYTRPSVYSQSYNKYIYLYNPEYTHFHVTLGALHLVVHILYLVRVSRTRVWNGSTPHRSL